MNEKDARKIILDAFRRLAMSHGLKRITIDMLAAECGISKKTIYKYYDSKEEIIEKFANDIVDKVKKEFYKIQLIEENPEQAMVKFFGIIWEIIRNIPATIIQDARMYYPKIERMIEDLKNEYNAVFVDNIKKGIAAGGTYARKIVMDVKTGRVFMKSITKNDVLRKLYEKENDYFVQGTAAR